jgi:predicted ABC-type ATPase
MENYLNADLIAAGLAPFAPEKVALEASKILLNRIQDCMRREESFALESTLSGKGHLKLLNKAKREGYHIVLHFLKLPSPEMARDRVRNRIEEGGHSIPPNVIERRFQRGLENLNRYKAIADDWKVWDTSTGTSELIDEKDQ